MSANLVSLLGDLEGRAKAMPALLQQVLQDTSSLQGHVDTSAQAAREVGLQLQSQATELTGQFASLDTRVQDERKRQAGRLADASAGLRALEKLGSQHLTDLEDDRKQTEGLVGKLSTRLGDLAKALHGDMDNERVAINGGLGALEKAQNRLATTYTKLLGELSNLDTAVNAAAQRTSGAVNQLLDRVQKAAVTADQGRQGLHTAATTQAKSFHEGLQQIHSQTVSPPTLGRTTLYAQSVSSLKASATGSVYSLKSALEQHDLLANQASTTFNNGYRNHESYSTGQTTSTTDKLGVSDSKLDVAWKKIPLDKDGNKDNRNMFQKGADAIVAGALKVWEVGAWAVKGVSQWVGTHHKEILVALGLVAVAVGMVMLAPVVLPALMAGASAAVGAIGSGLSAGMTLAGSALGGLGAGLAGLGSAAGNVLAGSAAGSWVLGQATSAWAMGTAMVPIVEASLVGGAALATVGGVLTGHADAVLYEGSRFVHYATHGMNGWGLAASILTLNPVPFMLATAATATVGTVTLVQNMLDPSRLQPAAGYSTGKSVAELDHALGLARLNKAVYWDQEKHEDSGGYQHKKNFVNEHNGFKAEIWEAPDGSIALVYRGSTTDIKNWGENLTQTLGSEAYHNESIYKEAVDTAREVQKLYPDRHIELTGHSLGGGLAQLASAATGLTSTVFNASAVNPVTFAAIGKRREDVHGVNYDVAGQALGQIQSGLGAGALSPVVALIPGVGLATSVVLGGLASDSQVAGETVVLAATDKEGAPSKMNVVDLHLWDAIEWSLESELKKAQKREGTGPPSVVI